MILVTGGGGQLAQELKIRLNRERAVFFSAQELDITDAALLRRAVVQHNPAVLINCAAYTKVDLAEVEPERAEAVNALALRALGALSREHGFHVVHLSTDYVFDGMAGRPYAENDPTHPLGVYGRTKLKGEQLLLGETNRATIIRTAWVYSNFGHNFLNTMLRLGATGKGLRVVCDQIGAPTYAGDLAEALLAILPKISETSPSIVNFTNEGVASWYDFAKAIFELTDQTVDVQPIMTSEYPTKARRPSYSVLDKSLFKTTFQLSIPYWREALMRCLSLRERQRD